MLFLTLGVFSRLGLRTLGEWILNRIEPIRAMDPAVIAAARSLSELPIDEVPAVERVAQARSNLNVLIRRRAEATGDIRLPGDVDLALALDRWIAVQEGVRVFRSNAGNFVRLAPTPAGFKILQLNDDTGLARAACPAEPTSADRLDDVDEPFYILGMDPPNLLHMLDARLRPNKIGMICPITVVEPSLDALFTGLSLIDLRAALANPRLSVVAGPDIQSRLDQLLDDRLEYALSGRVICVNPAYPGPQLAAAVDAAIDRQSTLTASLHDRVSKRDAARTQEYWTTRFRDAGTTAPPLRVMIRSSLFTTYIRHSLADLARSLEVAGCQTLLLAEPAAHVRQVTTNMLQRINDFDPDLVICANYHRRDLFGAVPPGVPFVCWIQDRMPHLFTTAAGKSLTPRDFVVGHLHPELTNTWHYPKRNMLMAPVVASDVKFHDAPISPDLHEQFACEIAYVSHHSAPPEALRDELLSRVGGPRHNAIRSLYPALQEIANDGLIASGLPRIAAACRDALRNAEHKEPTPEAVSDLVSFAGLPIVERFNRHEMLRWAADLCSEHNWRLHIHGTGWERFPDLAPFARGTINHDDQLRACYQAAGVHLHAGLGGVQHQRVMECALSGGCVAVRLKLQDLQLIDYWARNEIAATPGVQYLAEPSDPAAGRVAIADHWQAMLARSMYDRLGLSPAESIDPDERAARTALGLDPGIYNADGTMTIAAAQRSGPWQEHRSTATTYLGTWLLGDPADVGFWNEETFRRVVTPIVQSRERRDSISRWQRRATRENFTTNLFAQRVVECVRRGLLTPSP